LKDLALEGQPNGDPHGALAERYLGFTFAAIHVVHATDARLEGCRIRGWPSDGISMQQGAGNTVTGCWVQQCRGHGFHPGGGLRDSAFDQNLARGNGQDGLYFCMKVQHVIVSGNRFLENQWNGIGGLGDWGDQYNLVTNNVCQANGQNGIWVVDGANNTVANNICVNNSQKSPGQYSGILLNTTADTIVTGNRCLDDQETKTQKHGIVEFASCHGNLIANNHCRGNAQAGLALAGKDSQKSSNLE
jgi:parallel beta-helix repeat protein